MSRHEEPRVRSSVQAACTRPAFTERLGEPWYVAPASSFTLTFAVKEAPPFVDRAA